MPSVVHQFSQEYFVILERLSIRLASNYSRSSVPGGNRERWAQLADPDIPLVIVGGIAYLNGGLTGSNLQLNTVILTQTSPLAISSQLFHSKLKTLLFSKSYPDSSSSPSLPPRLNSKHHPP